MVAHLTFGQKEDYRATGPVADSVQLGVQPTFRGGQNVGWGHELPVRSEAPIETTLRAMMTTAHLGDTGPHPVIASAARELLNKSENERSGVLSTAMSSLGLYRDPVVAQVTRQCDWRIRDLVEDERPTTLYLVVPPSDISRTSRSYGLFSIRSAAA